ncbi:RCC1 domain-containing protein [Chryseobacterium sp. CT-SW4]|uniref:RCC1 domain-containing protein n=1 Tax=Chryseobacterium sp. SW-1 TaxID=3157343 RepID=UPI003B022E4A
MKKVIYIFLLMMVAMPLYGQFGIGTDKPQGKLDINQKDNKTRMGLVLPKVEKVEVDSIYTRIDAEDNESELVVAPSVTTFDNPFQTLTILDIDENMHVNTEYMRVPTDEAPEGTVVYDQSLGCIRAKQSETLGDWTDCLVDSQLVNEEINYDLYGGKDFKIEKVSAGNYFSVAIGADNKAVYTAGRGSYYRTGQGRTGNTPWTNIIGKPAVDVSAGYQHGAAVLEDGTLYTWGNNSNGATCHNTTSGNTRGPKKVIMPTNAKVIRVEAGYRNTLILTDDGKLYSCGKNSYGLNGNGKTGGDQKTPVLIENGLSNVKIKDISLAARGAAGLSEDGKIYTWGSNESGRLGFGISTGNSLIPTAPPTLNPKGTKFKSVAIGIGNGIAVTTDDKVYVWGSRALGTVSRITPAVLTPAEWAKDANETVVAVAAARHKNTSTSGSAAMILTDKSAYAVGKNAGRRNNFGRMGIVNNETGSIIRDQNGSFLEVESHAFFSGKPFTGISIGYNHALISTGESTENPSANYLGYGSGSNNYRQLGTTANRKVHMSLKK